MNNDNVRFGRVLVAVWLIFAVSQGFRYIVEYYPYNIAYWSFIAACPLVALSIVLLSIEIRRYFQSLRNEEEL